MRIPIRRWCAPPALGLLALFSLIGCSNGGGSNVIATTGLTREPTGGQWAPVVLSSRGLLRSPTPPALTSAQTAQELQELRTLQAQRTAQTNATVTFWDAGASIRWNEIARNL